MHKQVFFKTNDLQLATYWHILWELLISPTKYLLSPVRWCISLMCLLLYPPELSILLILYFTRSSATFSHGLHRKDEYCIFLLTRVATNFPWHILSLSKNWIQLSLKWIPWLWKRPKVIHLDKLVTFKMLRLLEEPKDPNTYLLTLLLHFLSSGKKRYLYHVCVMLHLQKPFYSRKWQ